MLRGLLMRRQSSQVSTNSLNQNGAQSYDGETSPDALIAAAVPGGSDVPVAESIYGDAQQDQGDEIRFSVELTRIDRLARSIGDLQDIVRALKTKGVALKATEQPIDTATAAGKAFLDMLGVFAEFETNLRRERQAEGIAKAKAEGVYKGRKPVIDPAKVRELQSQGLGATEIAERLGIGRASVYRVAN